MQWLIDEIFAPARCIGDQLAAAYNDDEIPIGVYNTVRIGDAIYPATKEHVFHALCFEPLAQMEEGLERADREFATLPPGISCEIRNLQGIVNGAVGKISIYDGAMYYAGTDIAECGKRGWDAVIRHLKGVPFPSARQAPAGDTDADLLCACGLPAKPAADVRESFDMALRLIQRCRNDADAAAAVALATAIARAGGQNVQSRPFGYEGPRVEHEGWLRREDLTRWLTQLGGLVAGGRFDADSARLAIEYALREYWLRAERFDAWRPGMPSGSGWTDVIQPQAAGIARAAQMAAEPAEPGPQKRPAPAIATAPWKAVAQVSKPEPAPDADNGAAEEATDRAQSTPTSGFLGGEALAVALGIHANRRDAFFRQLERRRLSLGDDCWHEVRDPRPNCPRFLYRTDSPKLIELAVAYTKPKPA